MNSEHVSQWDKDIVESVEMYNQWYLQTGYEIFTDKLRQNISVVDKLFDKTNYLQNINEQILANDPEIFTPLRMSACPPLAADRLAGLSGVRKSLIVNLEKNNSSINLSNETTHGELKSLISVIQKVIDLNLFPWLEQKRIPEQNEIEIAKKVLINRIGESQAQTALRNEQEHRQLKKLAAFLDAYGYKFEPTKSFADLKPGTYCFHLNVPVKVADKTKVNIPVDITIQPFNHKSGELPVFIEAKSAGDFTNVNKRRKEETAKMIQLKDTYGDEVQYLLLLGGYFNHGYLEYVAAEGIDWVWEHRLQDLAGIL